MLMRVLLVLTPLGCILGIMPYNFPFWQAFRFIIPTITAGNVVLLKHANNVTGCAKTIEKLFIDAGYPEGTMQLVITNHDQIEKIIENKTVAAVSLTGSLKAGKKIAEICGKQVKKLVLELGGNNACIIWDDVDLEKHMDTIVKARMQNNGQSCIAAKRFIVEEGVYDRFVEHFIKATKNLNYGNPLE